METDFTQEPAFQTILKSDQYGKLSPEKRKALLGVLGKMSPEERTQLAEGMRPYDVQDIQPAQGSGAALVNTPPRTPGQQAKSVLPLALDVAGQVGGGMAGGMIGAPLAGAAAGGYLANQANKAIGLREGKPFTEFTTDDALSAGVPAATGLLTGLGRATTRPAQKAIQAVDETQAGYQGKVAAREALVQEHEQALQDIPAQTKGQIKVEDYKKGYAKSQVAAERAAPIDLPELANTAKEHGVALRQPADPLQPQKYAGIAEVLGDWAETGQPLQRAIQTHQELGGLISKLKRGGGPELGAAKDMYAALSDDLQHAASMSTDPATHSAVTNYLKANAAFRKQLALEDYLDLFRVKRGYGSTMAGEKQVKTGQILDNFQYLKTKDRFFKGSFTPEELNTMEHNLQQLPKQRIPGNPPPPSAEELTPDVGSFPRGAAITGQVVGGTAGSALGYMTGMNPYLSGLAGSAAGGGAVAVPHWVSKALLAAGPSGEQIVRNVMSGKRAVGPKEVAALTTAARALGGKPTEE